MNEPSSSKEEMLARIRSALGHDGVASTPQPLPPLARQAVSHNGHLVGQFCDELEKVGGRVERLQSADDWSSYLTGLLADNSGLIVALSDSEVARRLGIRAWLAERKVRTIETLKEFAAQERGSAKPGQTDAFGASLMERYQQRLLEAGLGITSADYAIADTGTLVLVSGGEQHRLISLLPPVHMCLLETGRIMPDLSSLLARVEGEFYQGGEAPPQAMTFITGPSRTADIEHTLTMGVHGPSELHVLLYERDVQPKTGAEME
jgi:L-lactate dehydrogenase complex protein LldG